MELLRRTIRSAIGYRSWPYRLASRALTDIEILRTEGWRTMRALREFDHGGDNVVPVSFRQLSHPINLRQGGNDLATVLDTVVRQEYGKRLDLVPKTMIDAGAFIGDTSAWYLSRFKDLSVWALEPNPDNFEIARRNLAPYGERAHLLPFALSDKEGTVRFSGAGTGGSISDSGIEVQTISVPGLLQQIPGGRVDVLKIDIEGGEVDVFRSGMEKWLSFVKLIIVELHGPQIEQDVLKSLRRADMVCAQYRSIWYCRPAG